jgi:hypothetical protein
VINYRGAIIQKLEEVVEDNPSMTIGEILMQFLHKTELGKPYFYATDGEIYTSLENFYKNGVDREEQISEEAFNSWLNNK